MVLVNVTAHLILVTHFGHSLPGSTVFKIIHIHVATKFYSTFMIKWEQSLPQHAFLMAEMVLFSGIVDG